MRVEGEKRYALLLAARDSDYVQKVYGGYFNVFVAAYGEDGEKWDLFRVVEGEFPKMEELDKYEGFVISGSPNDAYGNDLWILRLCFLVQILYAMQKKVLGICFGHQILCRAFGGKVGKANGGWDIGLRKVKMVDDLSSCKYFQGLEQLPSSLSIMECHQDEVSEIPLGAEVIACSDKTGVEMFCLGDNVLGIQGHPEYTKDIVCNLIERLLDSNCIECGFAEDARATMEAADADRELWKKICKKFLKER
ncbi:gamma-glutamyl peptidase 5-like [Aristolochia californica]|uniref:gamma-glutamyl peptidase 5-like n=1 Tax=Aristolochia californica TaxID=171875 RepID=UPI0035E1564B